MITRRLALLLTFPLAAILMVQFCNSRQLPRPVASVALKDALTEQALLSLKNEYDILVNGIAPADGLVPRLVGMARLELSGEERIVALLNGREGSLQVGQHYTSIEVTLNSGRIEEREGRVVLRAVSNVLEHFAFDVPPSPAVPDVYEESSLHDFIFAVTPLSANSPNKPYSVNLGGFEYTLVKDVSEPDLLNASDPEEDDDQKYSRPPAIPLNVAPPVEDRQRRSP